MKRTQITELFANIRATAVSFFSIVMFVALGVGVFTGIMWAGDALSRAADVEFNKDNFHHFQIQFPYGLTNDDIVRLQSIDGVEAVEGAYASIQKTTLGEKRVSLRVQSIPAHIDALQIVEGEMPKGNTEIAMLTQIAKQYGISVGDTVSFSHDATSTPTLAASADDAPANTSGMKFLTNDTFTITALVHSPEYITDTNAAGWACYVPLEAFDEAAFQNAFPVVNIRTNIPNDISTYSQDYDTRSDALQNRIEAISIDRANKRTEDLRTAAQEAVDEGQHQVDEGQHQVDEGQAKLNEGQHQIDEGEKQLEEGQRQLADAQDQIAAGEQQLTEAEAELNKRKEEGEAQLAQAKALLDSGQAKLDVASAQLQLATSQLEIAQNVLRLIDSAKESVAQATASAREYQDKIRSMLDAGTIDIGEYNRLLDVYGAQLVASAKLALTMAGIGNINIPDVSSNNFGEFLDWANDRFPDEIEAGTIAYNGATMTIAELRERVTEGQQQVEQGRADVAAGEEELAARQAEYDAAVAQAQEQLDTARTELDEKRGQLDDAKAQVESGQKELEENKEMLGGAKDELEEKSKELEAGKEQLADAKERLEAGKEQLAGMKDYTWTILPRAYNGGAAEASTLAGITRKLSLSMAMLFVIVGLLVSYSAVSRIVHEQVTQIGTKKALGLRGGEITTSFMAYSGFAVVLGAIIGLIAGMLLVESIVAYSLGQRFIFGTPPLYFSPLLAAVISAVELVLILATTWFACHTILQRQAVDLLRGEEPPSGKQRFFEKWAVWKKLPLYTQTIVNNCLNDKRRVFSTIVGVAGCTALIVTAITLNDDILNSYDKHYDEVYAFDTIVYLDDESSAEDADRITGVLDDNGMPSAQVALQRCAITLPDGDRNSIKIVAPLDTATFAERYHITPLSDGQVNLNGSELWVSQAYTIHEGAKPGDTVSIDLGDGVLHELPITGFNEFWIMHNEAVVSPKLYESEFGTAPKANALYVDSNGHSASEIAGLLKEVSGVFSVEDDAEANSTAFRAFSNISNTVVAVYIVLSVVMAIVVLLNLNTMFIDEKKRELIVLMINGFSVKDAKRYIYNDTIVLTIIGVILGAILGTIMGIFTVASIELSSAVVMKEVVWRAVAIGVVGSALLSFIMSAVALRRVSRFNLTDINRF